ncbi:MAG: type II toxin-antitoxin system RelE/ParE family toxin, partial [Sedimenticola sp.]
MSFDVQQTRRFARQYKKLHNNITADVDAAVKEVVAQPSLG